MVPIITILIAKRASSASVSVIAIGPGSLPVGGLVSIDAIRPVRSWRVIFVVSRPIGVSVLVLESPPISAVAAGAISVALIVTLMLVIVKVSLIIVARGSCLMSTYSVYIFPKKRGSYFSCFQTLPTLLWGRPHFGLADYPKFHL